MRKLMIAMLALAVVFGFAACDNSNSGSTSLMDQYVVALEVTGPETYFAGEKVDLADYKVVGIQNNGGRIDLTDSLTFTYASGRGDGSNGLVLTADAGKTDSKDAKEMVIGTITYDGIYVGTINKPYAEVKATVYNVDAIDVDGPAVGNYFSTQTTEAFKYDDYTVTAYALADKDDNTSAVLYQDKLANKTGYSVEFGSAVSADAFQTGNWNVTFKSVSNPTAEEIAGGSTTAAISVKLDTLKAISIALKTGSAAPKAIVGVSKTATGYTAKDFVDVTYEMESGEKLVNDEYSGHSNTTIAWANSNPVTFTKGTTENITAEITVGETKLTATPVSVSPEDDYIVSFTIASSTGNYTVSSSLMTVKVGYKLDATTMTVTLVWASGNNIADKSAYAPSDTQLKNALKINGETTFDTTGYENGKYAPVSFTLEGLDRVNANTKCTITSVVMATTV